MHLYSIHGEIYSPSASLFSHDSTGDIHETYETWKAIG